MVQEVTTEAWTSEVSVVTTDCVTKDGGSEDVMVVVVVVEVVGVEKVMLVKSGRCFKDEVTEESRLPG